MKHFILITFLISLSFASQAHEVRPAFLELIEKSENTYLVNWKIPSQGDRIPNLNVVLSGSYKVLKQPVQRELSGFVLTTYSLEFEESIEGKIIKIDGLAKTLIDVLVRIEYYSGEEVTFLLKPVKDYAVIPGKSSIYQVMTTYTKLGIEHIWMGIDHLLFILALLLVTVGKWKIIKTITAFTIAHSITLSLASLGVIYVPGAIVESIIALSIVFVALEIVRMQEGRPSLTSRKPWIVAFTFGLLHGFGFASALNDIGLPNHAIPYALAFFNIGVEIGQIIFVFAVMILLYPINRLNINWPRNMVKIPAYFIGSIAAFWFIERLVGL